VATKVAGADLLPKLLSFKGEKIHVQKIERRELFNDQQKIVFAV
jgi:hypothetical protein